MEQMLQSALAPANLLYTSLLLVILIYWLTVFVGALDLNFLDFDLDTEADTDLELEADLEAEADGGATGSGWFASTLSFLNLGQVPFMVFLSFLALSLWLGAMLGYLYWGQGREGFFFLWLLPNLLIALLLTKVLTTPFKGLHQRLNQGGTQKRDLVGKIGEVILTVRPGSLGRIEMLVDQDTFTLDVMGVDEETIAVGQKALIVEYDAADDTYRVQRFDV